MWLRVELRSLRLGSLTWAIPKGTCLGCKRFRLPSILILRLTLLIIIISSIDILLTLLLLLPSSFSSSASPAFVRSEPPCTPALGLNIGSGACHRHEQTQAQAQAQTQTQHQTDDSRQAERSSGQTALLSLQHLCSVWGATAATTVVHCLLTSRTDGSSSKRRRGSDASVSICGSTSSALTSAASVPSRALSGPRRPLQAAALVHTYCYAPQPSASGTLDVQHTAARPGHTQTASRELPVLGLHASARPQSYLIN
ncbi:hypothetical protein TgHK011_010128 [Trichoderma gracile]|nr:hypothetical protein TgHK011_010128 [Trichoderma gracile]